MKTALLFVLAFVAAVGAVRAENLLDSVLASSTMDTQSTSAEPVKGAAKVQPAQGGNLLDGVLAAQPEPAEAEQIAPSASSGGNLLDMTLADPLPRKDAVAPSQPAPKGGSEKTGVASASAVHSGEAVPSAVNDGVEDGNTEENKRKPLFRIGPYGFYPRSSGKKKTLGKTAAQVDSVRIAPKSVARGYIENPATFSLRGGGASGGIVIGMEYLRPVGNSDFDISLRGTICTLEKEYWASYQETYYTYWYSWWSGTHVNRHTRTHYYAAEELEDHYLADCAVQWNPYRGSRLEPFIGLGARYDYMAYENDDYDETDGGLTYVMRLGLKLNFSRLSLTGAYIFGGDAGDAEGVSEAIGDMGFYVSRRMQLHAFVESFKVGIGSGTAVGGGISFDF